MCLHEYIYTVCMCLSIHTSARPCIKCDWNNKLHIVSAQVGITSPPILMGRAAPIRMRLSVSRAGHLHLPSEHALSARLSLFMILSALPPTSFQ